MTAPAFRFETGTAMTVIVVRLSAEEPAVAAPVSGDAA